MGNRWECGSAAYAQELVDAFTWWLSEKAEWHLEHKAKGGQIALSDWSATLFKDARIAAAWPVIADAIYEVELYKFDALSDEKKESREAQTRQFLHSVRTVLPRHRARSIRPARHPARNSLG